MKGEDFAAWLSAISGLNEGQRTEAIAALEKPRARSGPRGRFCEEGRPAQPKATRWERPVTSASRLRAVLIARDARSSVGAARTDFCGFAARAGAGGTFNALTKTCRWRICARMSNGLITPGR